MSYTALYRKFRPQNFNDVKGQDHIVTTLKNQIKADRVGHAYLFCGTRGTGKTTIAKILARAVNCEHPVDGSPCNECSMCKKIQSQTAMNVIEIDAASNNGVDNIREIIDEVKYSPTDGKYKVYIIDEVHMLSAGAFNALLKTLEEPPSYVMFILATTEVHKIPITILSRCQRYDFRRISITTIADRLKELMTEEGMEAEDRALTYVARQGDGSMRDALSLLDQCIAFYYGEKLTYDHVLSVLGAVDTEVFRTMLDGIQAGDTRACLKLLEEIVLSGRELGQFAIDFTWYLRNLLLIHTSENCEDLLEVSSEQFTVLKTQAMQMKEEVLIRFIRVFSDVSNQLKYASRKRIVIEVALIKLCKPEMENSYEALMQRMEQLEQRLSQGDFVVSAATPVANKTQTQKDAPKRPAVLPEAISEDIKEVAKAFPQMKNQFMKVSPALGTLLAEATLSVENDTLMFVVENGFDEQMIKEHMSVIEDVISRTIGKQVKAMVRCRNQGTERKEDILDLTKVIKMPITYED